jgi:hypothetical protein
VDIKGAKLIATKTPGHEETHHIVVLACCTNGIKLLPLLMFKRKCLVTKFRKEFLSTFMPKD